MNKSYFIMISQLIQKIAGHQYPLKLLRLGINKLGHKVSNSIHIPLFSSFIKSNKNFGLVS